MGLESILAAGRINLPLWFSVVAILIAAIEVGRAFSTWQTREFAM